MRRTQIESGDVVVLRIHAHEREGGVLVEETRRSPTRPLLRLETVSTNLFKIVDGQSICHPSTVQ